MGNKDWFLNFNYVGNSIKLPNLIWEVMAKSSNEEKTISSLIEETIVNYCESNEISCFNDLEFNEFIKNEFLKLLNNLANNDEKGFVLFIQQIKVAISKKDLIDKTREIIDIIFPERKIPEKRRMLKTLTFNKIHLIKFYENLLNEKYLESIKNINEEYQKILRGE